MPEAPIAISHTLRDGTTAITTYGLTRVPYSTAAQTSVVTTSTTPAPSACIRLGTPAEASPTTGDLNQVARACMHLRGQQVSVAGP